MSNDEKEKVILRWFDAVNQGDIPLLDLLADDIFTADFIEHDPRMPDFVPGPAGVKNFIHQVLSVNTGVHVTVQDIFTHGDKTAYRFSVSMKDVASMKPVDVQLLAITRFAGSQIVEEWLLSAAGKW